MILTPSLKDTLILPRDLSGNVLWLDANDPAGNGTIPSNSSSLSTFVDKSTSGHNFTQASGTLQPTNSNKAQNGRNAINFGASAENYMNSSAFNVGASFTFIFAFQTNLLSVSTAYLFDLNTTSTPEPYIQFSAGAAVRGSVWSGLFDRGSIMGTFIAGSNNIIVYEYNSSGNSAQLWLNGVSQGTTTNSSYSASSSVARRLGSHSSNHDYFDGLFFECALFNRILAQWEWQAIQSMMSLKWNIPVN